MAFLLYISAAFLNRTRCAMLFSRDASEKNSRQDISRICRRRAHSRHLSGRFFSGKEAQRAFVIGRNDGDDVFDAPFTSKPLDLRIELLSGAGTAAGAIHIDRKIGGAAVGAAGVEHIEISVADGPSRAVVRDDVRIILRDARCARGKFLRRNRLLFERDAGVSM